MKRSKRKLQPKNKLGRIREKLERFKASVRAKVEHPFSCRQELAPSLQNPLRDLSKKT